MNRYSHSLFARRIGNLSRTTITVDYITLVTREIKPEVKKKRPALICLEVIPGFNVGSRWIAGWCQQLADQRTQQPLAARPDVMNELKEPQVQRQTFLGNSPVGAEPRTQQRPEPFERIDMDLAEPIPVVVPGVLARGMADRLVVVAPFVQAAVDVIFIGVNDTPLGNRALDQGADRHLLDVLQHPDHHLTATLQHPEDRRLLLGQRSPAALPLQAPPPPGASFFFTASG